MTSAPQFTIELPDPMPSAEWLINDARERLAEGHTPDDLRLQWAGHWNGATELLAPVPVLAEWLGIDKASIYMARTRTRSDGALMWPDEDETILGRKMWRFSTIALHRATAPARGHNLRSEFDYADATWEARSDGHRTVYHGVLQEWECSHRHQQVATAQACARAEARRLGVREREACDR